MTVLVIGSPQEPFWDALAPVRQHGEVVITDDEATARAAAGEADVIYMWDNWPLLEKIWPAAGRLRWVHCAWAGVDRILFSALLQSEVPLTRTVGIYGSALAEYALACMLHFAKRIPEIQEAQRQRAWRKLNVYELAGRTLVVLGMGDVGLTLAGKARGLGLRVIGVRRREEGAIPAEVDEAFGLSQLGEALAQADYLVMALPLTEASRHLIGAPQLARLPESAVLINIGRGGTVDEAALIEALREGRLRGAALDVFEEEPLTADNPVFNAPRLLISSHTVDTVAGWERRAIAVFNENHRRYLAGEPLQYLVDKAKHY